MQKIAIIINGTGCSGKDTFCDIIAKEYKTRNVSSITPIKELAKLYGWNGVKDERGRELLSSLKSSFSKYNNLPTRYIVNQYEEFQKNPSEEVFFVHIREKEEMEKFKKSISGTCYSLLVKREGVSWNNSSDKNVEQATYDFCYENNKSLEEMPEDVLNFFKNMIEAAH